MRRVNYLAGRLPSSFRHVFVLLLIAFHFFSCETQLSEQQLATYRNEHAKWQAERISKLKAPEGYLNLAGLYWLKKGSNSFGSDTSNAIVLPAGLPASLGKLLVTNTHSVLLEAGEQEIKLAAPGSDSSWVADQLQLVFDDSLRIYTRMQAGDWAWHIIRRGEQLGLRLRHYKHPKLDSLRSIESFPLDIAWNLTAEFEPYNPPKILQIQNILGGTYEQPSPGRLVFQKDGEEFSLDVTEEGDTFFVTFSDVTSGEETYGGGRYIYTEKPDQNGEVVIDFNKAYNPPCVYTEYATCPLPPPQNKMNIAVLAGEKYSLPH